MKYVNLSPEIFYSQKVGGISRYFFELAQMNSVYVRVINNVLFSDNIFVDSAYSLRKNPLMKKMQCKLNDYYFKFASKSDVHHLSYYNPGALMSKRRKGKNVITVYDCIHERLGVDNNDRLIIERKKKCIEKADKIISISMSTTNDLVDIYGISEDKVSTIYLGVDQNGHSSRPIEFVAPELPYLMFVGSRHSYKNFDKLINAFSLSRFRKEGGIIIAFGQEVGQADIELLKKHGLTIDDVRFVSGDDQLLSAYYSHAILHVVPSAYEGFGLTPFESIVNNCPTVVNRNTVFEELFGNYQFIYDLNDIDTFVGVIDQTSFDTIRRQNKQFMQESAECFSWDMMRKKTEALYLNM